jgi:hypothetical protein
VRSNSAVVVVVGGATTKAIVLLIGTTAAIKHEGTSKMPRKEPPIFPFFFYCYE